MKIYYDDIDYTLEELVSQERNPMDCGTPEYDAKRASLTMEAVEDLLRLLMKINVLSRHDVKHYIVNLTLMDTVERPNLIIED